MSKQQPTLRQHIRERYKYYREVREMSVDGAIFQVALDEDVPSYIVKNVVMKK